VVASSVQDLRTGNDEAAADLPTGRGQRLQLAARPGAGPGTAVVSAMTQELPAQDPVRLTLSPAPVAAAGEGWSCLSARGDWECTHAGGLAAHTLLPELRLDLRPDGFGQESLPDPHHWWSGTSGPTR
jgi:hypothetical protein